MIMIIKMISILIQLLATQDRYYKSHMLGCRKMRRSCIEEVLCQQIAKLQVHRKNSSSQIQNKICGSLSLGTTFLLESEMVSILRVPGICQTFGYTIIPYPLSLSYIFLKKITLAQMNAGSTYRFYSHQSPKTSFLISNRRLFFLHNFSFGLVNRGSGFLDWLTCIFVSTIHLIEPSRNFFACNAHSSSDSRSIKVCAQASRVEMQCFSGSLRTTS